MSCDCSSVGLDEIFTKRNARSDGRRFVRRGLDPRARRLLRAIEAAHPLKDAHTLEIGAGVGGFSIEIARRGAASVTTVDAVPPSVAEAKRLADVFGVSDRMHIIPGDFTELAERMGEADIVILDRVVCCYPEGPSLLELAARHARSVVALSYPRDAWWTSAFFHAVNAGQTVLRRRFRLFLHEPAELHARLRSQRFDPQVVGHFWPWELTLATRRG